MYSLIMQTSLHHKVFGEGLVLSVDGGVSPPTLEVLFLSVGEKKLKANPEYWLDSPKELKKIIQKFNNPLIRVAERLDISCEGKTSKEISKAIAHHDHEIIDYNESLARQYATGILVDEDESLFKCPDCPNAFCTEKGFAHFVCERCKQDFTLEDFSPEDILEEDEYSGFQIKETEEDDL